MRKLEVFPLTSKEASTSNPFVLLAYLIGAGCGLIVLCGLLMVFPFVVVLVGVRILELAAAILWGM